jgi:integrase
MRWSELKRLRFQDFDLVRGVINLSADKTKNYKAATVTIPPIFLTVLRQPDFTKYPSNYLIFGAMGKPHPSKNCGENTLRNRHKKLMEGLKEKNLLTNIEGLTPYSWKDTGITCLIEKVGAQATKNHARHSTEEQTNTYVQKKEINELVKSSGLNIAG